VTVDRTVGNTGGNTGVPCWVGDVADEISYPTVFVTVSGAHLYGFASVDSDVDLRGVHLLPAEEVVGLRHGPQTLQKGGVRDGVELDLVTHDLGKFLRLLLKPNGYVAEQLLSPLVVRTTQTHEELTALAPGCLTRHHAHHYLGFAETQWKLFAETGELKPALYSLRVLLTGIHLMRTGEIEADLRRLWTGHTLPYIPDLIAAKAAGEHRAWVGSPGLPDSAILARDVTRLRATLVEASAESHLPERPSTYGALHDLLVRARFDRPGLDRTD